jgi:hypothetical protein
MGGGYPNTWSSIFFKEKSRTEMFSSNGTLSVSAEVYLACSQSSPEIPGAE